MGLVDEFLFAKGLGDIRVSFHHVQPHHLVKGLGLGGEDRNGELCELGVAPYLFEHFPAVHLGHGEVEKDRVRLVFLHPAVGGGRVKHRLHLEILGFQNQFHQFRYVHFVLDDNDFLFHGIVAPIF
jgi:hypothetical protein